MAPPQRRWEDPIVKETREAREELFARFNHDLAALCRFFREKEREHSDRVVTLEPRRPEPEELAIKSPEGARGWLLDILYNAAGFRR